MFPVTAPGSSAVRKGAVALETAGLSRGNRLTTKIALSFIKPRSKMRFGFDTGCARVRTIHGVVRRKARQCCYPGHRKGATSLYHCASLVASQLLCDCEVLLQVSCSDTFEFSNRIGWSAYSSWVLPALRPLLLRRRLPNKKSPPVPPPPCKESCCGRGAVQKCCNPLLKASATAMRLQG